MGFRIVGLMNCWMEIVIKELWAGELCCKLAYYGIGLCLANVDEIGN